MPWPCLSPWVVDATKRLDRISVGAQMNDENTEHHMARYLSPEASLRLEMMRNKYDPDRRFPGFLVSTPAPETGRATGKIT